MKLEYLNTKTNVNTLKIEDYFIHSKYNPLTEAELLAKKIYTPHHVHLLFGYGCGYLVDSLLKECQFNEPIFVIDPLFKMEELIIQEQHKSMHLFNEESIGKWHTILSSYAFDYRISFKIHCLSNYDKLFPEIYKELLIDIKGVQYKNRVNDYTLLRYSKDWQENFTRNAFYLQHDQNLFDLEKKYDCPVIVASGGPSLNKQIPLLKKYRNQFILIASGSTATSLYNSGIEPDYVVTIDGGMPNYEHFKNIRFENAIIMYTMQNHPGVRNSFLKNGYVFNLDGFSMLTNYLKKELGLDLPVLPGGGSVAHSAFSIAQTITSGPIALVGQDLAFTDNLTHAKHNIHAREVDKEFLEEREGFQTEGYNGDLIWTTPVFYSMKLEFEDLLVVSPPENKFFNCTEGGITIRNFPQSSLEQFFEKFLFEENIVDLEPVEGTGLLSNIENQIKNEIMHYKKIIKELETGLEGLKRNKGKDFFDDKTIKKLDKIDKVCEKLIRKLPIETITVPVTMKVMRSYLPKLNETPQETFNRVMEQTKVLYTELKEAIYYCLDASQKVLDEEKEKTQNVRTN